MIRRSIRFLAASLPAIASAVLAGCGGAPAPGPAGETLVALTPAIQHAYDAYWDAWLAASRVSDPDLSALAVHAANPHLEVLRANLAQARRDGHVVEGSVVHDIRGMYAYGSWYKVVDCVDLTGWTVHDATTGQQLPQLVDRPRQLGAMTIQRVDGVWKVTHGQLIGDC
jgi:hypothetical protein